MTTEQQPPDWVRAWAIALNVEVNRDTREWTYFQPGEYWVPIPDRDSGDYFKAVVLAVTAMSISKFGDYLVRWVKLELAGEGSDPDPVSALIAAVLASKGGGK